MASITRRGKTYTIVVSNGYGIDGKKKRFTMTYKPSAKSVKGIEKEINKVAFEFEKRVKEQKILTGERITFHDFSETWKNEWLKNHVTLSVQEKYIRNLDKYIRPDLDELHLSAIRPLHIQKIINSLIDKGLSTATVKDIFVVINSIFKYAFQMEIVESNPCSRCELPKRKKNDALHYFTADQCKRFLDALETMEIPSQHKETTAKRHGSECNISEYTEYHKIPFQYVALFYLAIYSGLRRGELLGLTWHDIDFNKNTVTVNKAFSNTKTNGQYLKEPKTASSNRTVVVPDECIAKIKEWKIRQFELSNNLGNEWKGTRGKHFDENFVFIQLSSGQPMFVDTPTAKFKSIIRQYNSQCLTDDEKLPEIRFHDLRHTSATILISNGINVATVSRRLGHSRTSTTLDIYTHSLPELDQTASDKIRDILNRKEETDPDEKECIENC